ncbi:hypothetical protein V8E36_008932 [Tilletia maclaganii]
MWTAAGSNNSSSDGRTDNNAALHRALELEDNLRDIVLSLSSVLQLRRHIHAGQGERASCLIPLPLPQPAHASTRFHHVAAAAAAAAAPHTRPPSTGLGTAYTSDGIDIIMAARVRKLAAQCHSYLGKTHQLRDWLIHAITAVDAELERQLKLHPLPPEPEPILLPAAPSTSLLAPEASATAPAPILGGSSAAAPIDLANDDDDDELPLGQLRDRRTNKNSPTKPATPNFGANPAGTLSNHLPAANGSGSQNQRKRKRISSSAAAGKNAGGNNVVVDLTGDTPSPPSQGGPSVAPTTTVAPAQHVTVVTNPHKTPKLNHASTPSGGAGAGSTPKNATSPAVNTSPASAAVAGSKAKSTVADTQAQQQQQQQGDLFSMTQPELDLSALHYDFGRAGAGAAPGGAGAGTAKQQNKSSAAASRTSSLSTSMATSSATPALASSTAPAPVANNTTTALHDTAAPPPLTFGGTNSFGLGLDPEAMAMLGTMDLSHLDFGNLTNNNTTITGAGVQAMNNMGGGVGPPPPGGAVDGMGTDGVGVTPMEFQGIFDFDGGAGADGLFDLSGFGSAAAGAGGAAAGGVGEGSNSTGPA